jgi:predicted dehydrogenase
MYFTWLAGDHIVEQHMHQHDIANWVIGSTPRLCIGVGGRQVRTDPAYGHIYDHFAVDYEYPNGARVTSICRQTDGCYNRMGENFIGTKGSAIPESKIMDEAGKNIWKYDSQEEINPYVQEHADLIASIRAGKPLNEAKTAAESTLTAIMGRMAAYTGKIVTWTQAMNSKLDLMPKKLEFGPIPTPPVAMPGKDPFV